MGVGEWYGTREFEGLDIFRVKDGEVRRPFEVGSIQGEKVAYVVSFEGCGKMSVVDLNSSDRVID